MINRGEIKMRAFDISDDFYLDEKPFKVISGAIHYFRVVPEYWRDRLEKLRLLGCNTVETYVPWNMHEPQEGNYNFKKECDLRKFIKTAHEVGLYVILRPSPYICAEWEFGGLPYWLLKDSQMKLRFSYAPFMEKIERYFNALFQEVIDLQITMGGPIIMMQVENEYGGYANDKDYLKQMAGLMRKMGVDVPLVTSDGPWGDMLENGSIPGLALPTINCGSNVKEHFKRLKEFHNEKKPLMVMEFWIGWFDAWEDGFHHTTSTEDATKELADILSEGSVNIYMFQGGTNFGFMNGSNYYEKLAPDVTSYDYDALLTESGEITPKYRAFQKVISEHTEIPQLQLSTKIEQKSYGGVAVEAKVALLEALSDIGTVAHSAYPLTMEDLNQGYGYVYYQSEIGAPRTIEDFRLVNVMDRVHVSINEKPLFTLYDHETTEKKSFELFEETNTLGLLVENMGRVNYSVKMNHQKKGIQDGVVINGAFQSEWENWSLPMDNLGQLDFSKGYINNVPAFYRFILEVDVVGDTFLDLEGWGKGFVTINGFNLGRFWKKGPQKRLYVPGPILKQGENEVIIFETEGETTELVTFYDTPDLGPEKPPESL